MDSQNLRIFQTDRPGGGLSLIDSVDITVGGKLASSATSDSTGNYVVGCRALSAFWDRLGRRRTVRGFDRGICSTLVRL